MLLATIRAIAVFGLLAALPAEAQEDDETAMKPSGGLRVYVKKKGADIRFYRSLSSGSQTGQITVKFSEIREVDADGKAVPGKRSFSNFNSQEFNISSQSDIALPNAFGMAANYNAVTLITTLPNVDAQLKIQVYVIQTGGGIIVLGNETSMIYEGQLKFTVEVRGWNWGSGVFIELDINVQIPPGRLVKEENDGSTDNHPKQFSFGAGATASFSKKVQVDNGAWQDMAPGYPKFTQNGANNIFTLRLPRFNTSALYDPSFDPGTSKGSCTIQSSFTLGIVCCLVFMLREVL